MRHRFSRLFPDNRWMQREILFILEKDTYAMTDESIWKPFDEEVYEKFEVEVWGELQGSHYLKADDETLADRLKEHKRDDPQSFSQEVKKLIDMHTEYLNTCLREYPKTTNIYWQAHRRGLENPLPNVEDLQVGIIAEPVPGKISLDEVWATNFQWYLTNVLAQNETAINFGEQPRYVLDRTEENVLGIPTYVFMQTFGDEAKMKTIWNILQEQVPKFKLNPE